MLGHFLELLLFILTDVAEFAFGKTLHEERHLPLAKKNDATVTLGLAFRWAGDSLFDDTTTQVRIDLSLFRTLDGIPKRISRDSLPPGKAPKPCVFENLQAAPLWLSTHSITQGVTIIMPDHFGGGHFTCRWVESLQSAVSACLVLSCVMRHT